MNPNNEPHKIDHLFALRDDKLGSFFPPNVLPNNAVAIRQFNDLVNDKGTEVAKHSEDFSIWYLGDFDATVGCFSSPESGIVCLARGSDFAKGE